MIWNKTSEKLPESKNDEKDTQCLVYYDCQIRILVFNHVEQCWDDEDGDDYCCDIERVEYWMETPEVPKRQLCQN